MQHCDLYNTDVADLPNHVKNMADQGDEEHKQALGKMGDNEKENDQ